MKIEFLVGSWVLIKIDSKINYLPLFGHHILIVWSFEPEANLPSSRTNKDRIEFVWPINVLTLNIIYHFINYIYKYKNTYILL